MLEIHIKYRYEGIEWTDMVEPPVFTSKEDAKDFIDSIGEDEDGMKPQRQGRCGLLKYRAYHRRNLETALRALELLTTLYSFVYAPTGALPRMKRIEQKL